MPALRIFLGKSFADKHSTPAAMLSRLYWAEVTELRLRGQTDWEQACEVCKDLNIVGLLCTDQQSADYAALSSCRPPGSS